jgi:phosphonate transport system substrate-binding protein
VGVAPTDPPEALRKRHAPVLGTIQDATGVPTDLVIPANDDELVRMFHDRTIDMAYLGGYSYLLVRDRDGAEPLVMRDADLRSTSVFLIRSDTHAARLEDLKGARIGFGERRSPSGHLMPRIFLERRGIAPEEFFSQTFYSGGHDTTAHWVRDRKVDVGTASGDIVRKMFRDGRLDPTAVRILWETPDYPEYVWAVQHDLSPGLVSQIQDRLLALSRDEPAYARILDAAGAESFLPALDTDFQVLRRETVKLSGLEPGR